MSAEVLRKAAADMRQDWLGTTQEEFYSAVADWLGSVHADLSTYNATTTRAAHAFTVARAYLGEQS